jgi:hypothetical protein
VYELQRDERKKCLRQELELHFRNSGVDLDEGLKAAILEESLLQQKKIVGNERTRRVIGRRGVPAEEGGAQLMLWRSSHTVNTVYGSTGVCGDESSPRPRKVKYSTSSNMCF